MPDPRLAAEQKTFARMITLVAKRWKADGFVRRAQQFNRTTPEGIVQAVGFQKFAPASPGMKALLGGHDPLAGHFCVGFRIVVPDAREAMGNPALDFYPATHFDWLSGRLDGDSWEDGANSLARPPEDLAVEVLRRYDATLAPLFEDLATRRGIVDHFDRGGLLADTTGHLGREAYGYCLASIGQHDRARLVLQRLVDAARAKGRRQPDPYVERIVTAARRGWRIELRT